MRAPLRPNLTLAETGGIVVLGLAILMLPIAPLSMRYSAAAVFVFFFATLISRNIAIIITTVLALTLSYRFFYPGSAWHDQPWAQWYSISSLLTGHNLLVGSPLVGMSMAAYMPMGDLFGGLFIALGLDEYWRVWHVVVSCLLLVPVIARPSAATLMLFIGTAGFFPFCDYTTAGGTLEISYALIIAAILLYRCGRITASLPLFAFACMFRQPNIMLIPFVFLVLWKDRDYYRAGFFAALLFCFGGLYILLDPKGAYMWLFRYYDSFLEGSFNEHNGLNLNYSISSLPHTFGINDKVAWTLWPTAYLILLILSIATLLFIAYRMSSRDNVLFLGVVATIFVYLFSRGYAQFHYVAATAFPLAAFQISVPLKTPKFLKYWGRGLALFLIWVGLVPLAWFVIGRADAALWNFRGQPHIPVAATQVIGLIGNHVPVPNVDGINEHRRILRLEETLEFDFAQPVLLSAVRLSGDYVGVTRIHGINTQWATETEMRGIVEDGEISYSIDGTTFAKLQEIDNHTSYSGYPVTWGLHATPGPIRSLRIHAKKLYQQHQEWIVGNVEFFGRKP